MQRAPINQQVHDWFVHLGYTHTPHEYECEDVGDAESGPDVWESPEWDEYTTEEDRYIVDCDGHVVHWEKRDLAFEAWVDQQASI